MSSPATLLAVCMTLSLSSSSDLSPTSAKCQGAVLNSGGVVSAITGTHLHTHVNMVQLQIVPLGVAQQGETILESGAPIFLPNLGH